MGTKSGQSGPEIEYGISELAEEFDVTLRSLRFYEQKELLSPRRNGKNRIYSRGDRTRLKLILLGKRVGLSLLDIKAILDLYDGNGHNLDQLYFAVEKGEEQMRGLAREREEIEDAMGALDETLNNLRRAITGAETHALRKALEPSPLHA